MPINTHPVTNEDVMAYLDGELSPADAAEMAAHLAQCRTCQELAADLQIVSRQLAGWTAGVSEGDGIPQNVVAALEARAANRKKRPASIWSWRFVQQHPGALTAAASIAVLVLAGVLYSTLRSPVSQSSMEAPRSAVAEMSLPAPAPSPVARSGRTSSATPKGQAMMSLGMEAQQRPPSAPLVVLTAELHLTARNFDTVRSEVDRILLRFGGHIAQLDTASPTGEARSLNATLRIPSPQLDPALSELRKLGHVDGESQRGDEVTQQSIDLEARLANARHTEARLVEILRTRTGKLSDVLEVEEKLSEVRGMIEQAEAEQKSLNNRVSFATVSLRVTEDYRPPLAVGTPSLATGLRDAAVKGVRAAFDGIVGVVQGTLEAGPSVLLVALLVCLPVYFVWKKLRH